LEDGIDNPLLICTRTPRCEIPRNRLVDLDKSSLLIHDLELMLVNQFVVSRAELTGGLVVLVQEGNVSVAMTIAGVVVALEAEEDFLALPSTSLEVGRPDRVAAVARLHKIAVVPEDVRTSLARAVLFRWSIRNPGERRNE
jgi:hypothetical protein